MLAKLLGCQSWPWAPSETQKLAGLAKVPEPGGELSSAPSKWTWMRLNPGTEAAGVVGGAEGGVGRGGLGAGGGRGRTDCQQASASPPPPVKAQICVAGRASHLLPEPGNRAPVKRSRCPGRDACGGCHVGGTGVRAPGSRQLGGKKEAALPPSLCGAGRKALLFTPDNQLRYAVVSTAGLAEQKLRASKRGKNTQLKAKGQLHVQGLKAPQVVRGGKKAKGSAPAVSEHLLCAWQVQGPLAPFHR